MARGVTKQAAFLGAFALTADLTKAAAAAGIDRSFHYRWLKDDADYPARFAAVKEAAADALESEAVRRAHRGVFKPLVYQGEFTYPRLIDPKTGDFVNDANGKPLFSKKPLGVREYSDPLLMFLLKGFRPEKYRDRTSTEISAPGGEPLNIQVTFVTAKPEGS